MTIGGWDKHSPLPVFTLRKYLTLLCCQISAHSTFDSVTLLLFALLLLSRAKQANHYTTPLFSIDFLMFQLKVEVLRHLEAVLCFKPVGEVLLPRRSGILSSSLCRHHRLHNRHIYRSRIPRARRLCGPFHRRLLSDELGANFSSHSFRRPCRRLHQWLPELSTLRH